MEHVITGVEIPVKDMDRAVQFYSALLAKELQQSEDGPRKTAMLPYQEGQVSFYLTQVEDFEPGPGGPLPYINTGDDLSAMLGRVESAGGKIIMPKTSMGEFSFFATFNDSEGNTIALYSTG